MPTKSSKRTAPTTTGNATKRPRARAEVHQLQEKLAERMADKASESDSAGSGPGIIIASRMGTGKPRIVGKALDRIVPERVAALEENVLSVLTIIVVTDAKHGREQATQYGTDLPGPYHDSDLGPLLRLLNGERSAARIMIPFATFRKMCYGTSPTQTDIWALLHKVGKPDVIVVIDEVHEVYKAANGRLPKAADALRTRYETLTDATISVFGMSGTPMLDDATYAARAKTLFGTEPTLTEFTEAEQEELLEAINPQLKVSTREGTTEVKLPSPDVENFDDNSSLNLLSTLVVGNALFNDVRGDSAVKKLAGEFVAQQILGADQDGGVLFQQLAPGGKVPMLKVNRDGVVGKKACSAHEAVLVAVDSPYGTQALFDGLEELQERSGTDELCPFTVHDLRLEARTKATKEADKVPHEWLKRGVADQKAALRAGHEDAAAQTGTTFSIIDKRQALSGTNDFAKNVQRTVAIGDWEPHEIDQFNKRLCRACELKEGDLVPNVFYGVHISSQFAANLMAPTKERAADKALLTDDAKEELAKLKEEDTDSYHKAKTAAKVLAATGLPYDPALKYLECRGDPLDMETFKVQGLFKVTEYMPLIEHHKDCDVEEETDDTTGKVKKTVKTCCKECKCIFHKDE